MVKKNNIVLEELKVEQVAIDAVKPNAYNPNRMGEREFDLLKKSMSEDGFTTPIIVMQESREIVDGEHRWRAWQDLGNDTIPVVFVNMSEAQRRMATIRHNTARGSHDIELEAAMLKDLEKLGALDWAKDGLGLDENEIDVLLNDFAPTDDYGADEEFSQAWDYSEVGEEEHLSTATATAVSKLSKQEKERAQKLGELDEADVKLTRRHFTFTKNQEAQVQKVLGDEQPAEKLAAIVNQHAEIEAKTGTTYTAVSLMLPNDAVTSVLAKLDAVEVSEDLTTIAVKRGVALVTLLEE